MKIKAKVVDGKIIVEKPKDVGRLHTKSHLGETIKEGKLELNLIESCFLLDEGKIDIKEEKKTITFEKLTNISSKKINDFDIKYLAFKDLRKRGCIVTVSNDAEEITFSDYKKEFFVYVFSEKKYFNFKETFQLIKSISQKNVSSYFAIVDSEGDVTYYDVSCFDFKGLIKKEKHGTCKGVLFDNGVLIYDEKIKKSLFEKEFFGKPFGDALRISFVEAAYLSDKKILEILDNDNSKINYEKMLKKIKEIVPNFEDIYNVYCDLKKKNVIVKTGFKFGTDFRVYTDNPDEIHAKYLVQVINKNQRIVWSEMSRIIRLAHSVNKEIIFVCKDNRKIEYIRFGRLRP